MDVLLRIEEVAKAHGERVAFISPQGEMTYGELWEYSGRLCQYLKELGPGGPLAVWGHKSPWMLVCFLALARSKRGYCPLDTSIPYARAKTILDNLGEGPLFAVEDFPGEAGRPVLGISEIREICMGTGEETKENGEKKASLREEKEWESDSLFYVIFTSGSTGTPKGVQITRRNLSHFLDWSVGLAGGEEGLENGPDVGLEKGPEKEKKTPIPVNSIPRELGRVFLNQAPFSFDLSVMDMYTCLVTGGTLYCLSREEQGDYKKLLSALSQSCASVWVSTPSFAQMCLADPGFNRELMKNLSVMLFCGETLPGKTVKRLLDAFPGVRIFNTYGPTESTVAVTEILVDEELLSREDPLPVGYPKPGTLVEIWDAQGNPLPEGERGEVILMGDTVALGYLGREDLTQGAFFTRGGLRGYHTGDEGYLRGGCLYFCGRMDLQVKLHGYRMELGDIESALLSLAGVEQAVVIPRLRQGKVSSLVGVLVLSEEKKEQDLERIKEYLERMKEELKGLLPEYMIPKKLMMVEEIPVTANGKADRRALAGRL